MPKKVKLYKKKVKVPESEIIKKLQSQYKNIDIEKIRKFTDFPLSQRTLDGLTENGFTKPSEIQRKSIGFALDGRDVLACAPTGSGKTLAFLIPVLEILFCNQWTVDDGLGALIISPTRELARQIYETLLKIGQRHRLISMLISGGYESDLNFKKSRIDRYNIIVCTPGRLLQHMDQNPSFNCDNLKVLVLDEADHLMKPDFRETVDGILANLPTERSTLLFSATLPKSVKSLARLSLRDPADVFIKEYSIPEGLQQNYTVCEIGDKVSILWSFLRTHLKQKIIVFFQSCKQVKYMNEIFCAMRPGVSLLALYGTLSQMRRNRIADEFRRKQHVVLFATDVAARGLDFPNINWVVQMDCPEDTDTYLHRVGRTARFFKGGDSLLVLLPSELEMIQKLEDKHISVNKIRIPAEKIQNPEKKMCNILVARVEYKESAHRAFLAYIKSVALMKDKSIFNVKNLDFDAFAKSLGLLVTPRVRFLKRLELKDKKETAGAKKNEFADISSESEDDVLTMKRTNIDIENEVPHVEIETEEMRAVSKKAVTKAAVVKKMLKKNIVANTKTTFDDEGQEVIDPTKTRVSQLAKQYENSGESGINIEIAKKILKEEDKIDKEKYRANVKERHREKKKKLKEKLRGKKDDESEGDFSDDEDRESDESLDDFLGKLDPDKYYGKKKGGDETSGEEDDDEEEDEDEDEEEDEDDEEDNEENDDDEEELGRPTKRKRQVEQQNQRKKMRTVLEPFNDLRMDEALAMQLLEND